MQPNASALPESVQSPMGPQPVVVEPEQPLPDAEWQRDLDDYQTARALETLSEAGADIDPDNLVNLARKLDELA